MIKEERKERERERGRGGKKGAMYIQDTRAIKECDIDYYVRCLILTFRNI